MYLRSTALLLLLLVTTIWLAYEWRHGRDSQEMIECPHDQPSGSTHFSCTRHPDYSEICFYENLCWDRHASIYLLNSSLSEEAPPRPMSSPEASATRELDETRLRFPLPWPESVGYIPYAPGMKEGLSVYEVSPGHKQVQRADWESHRHESVYLVPQLPQGDRRQFIESNMMIYEAQRLNETMRTFMGYPALDQVYLLRSPLPQGAYEEEILSVMLPNNLTPRYWQDKQERTSWMCFSQATVVGSKPQFYSGVSEGENWKSRLYERTNLTRPLPRGFTREEGFQPTVTIYNPSVGSGRWRMGNVEQIEALLDHYHIAHALVDEKALELGLKENGGLLGETDVLLSVHDEFLVNLMWLNAHSSLIEVLPSSVFNNRYETHARALTLNYRPVRSWLPLEDDGKSIQVPLREVEMAVIEAFDLQAVSILGRATQLYISLPDVSFQENDWNHDH